MLKLRCYLGQRMVFPQSTFRCYVSWGNRFQVDNLIFDIFKLQLNFTRFSMMDLDSHPFKCLISTNLSRGFRVTRSPSRREHLELCEWWGNLPPRSCWPRSQAEVQKEHTTELRNIADCSTFICMFFLHTKLFNMDHFISFEMFGNPSKQISLGQMFTRFWRMLKWLSICLFFNIWVSKHVNVFLHPGTKIQPPKVYI